MSLWFMSWRAGAGSERLELVVTVSGGRMPYSVPKGFTGSAMLQRSIFAAAVVAELINRPDYPITVQRPSQNPSTRW